MYLGAMKLGFTPSDLRTMSYPLLANMFDEWTLMNGTGSSGMNGKQEVRMATQADIDRLLA